MAKRSRKEEKGLKQIAAGIVRAAEQDIELTAEQLEDAASAALGRLGGLKRAKAKDQSAPGKPRSATAAKSARAKTGRKRKP